MHASAGVEFAHSPPFGGGQLSGRGVVLRVDVFRDTRAPGSIAPGTYSSVRVVGFCLGPPSGNVIVTGDVNVAKGAVLAANYPAFAPGAPEGDATWLVRLEEHTSE